MTGNRSDSNNYTLDGVDNNENFFKFHAIKPSIDAIEEFKIQTNITSAQFGAAAGANVNVATKSGTNEFHGAAFEFLRNNVLDSREVFATTRPQFRYNDFGGTIGGPIKKDQDVLAVQLRGHENTAGTDPPGNHPDSGHVAG